MKTNQPIEDTMIIFFGNNILNKADTARRHYELNNSLAIMFDQIDTEDLIGTNTKQKKTFNEQKRKLKLTIQERKEQTNPELIQPNYKKIH